MTIGLGLEMKVSKPKKWKVNGKVRWVWDGVINGKRKREQFASEKDCKAFIRSLGKDKESAAWWTDLTPTDRVDIMAAFNRAKEDGFSLLSAVESHAVHGQGKKFLKKMTLEEAIGGAGEGERKFTDGRHLRPLSGYLGWKKKRGDSKISINGAKSSLFNLMNFIGKEKIDCKSISRNHCENFIFEGGIKKADWSKVTKITKTKILNAFFEWLIKEEVISENPCAKITRLKPDEFDPQILTIDQCKDMLATAATEMPNMLAALCINLFCGIRPSEIMRHNDSFINKEHKEIEMVARNTKTKRRRYVDISDNCWEWLKIADKLDETSIDDWRRFYLIMKSRWQKSGGLWQKNWDKNRWPHDCLRHSYCSYHLAFYEDAGKTAMQAGHDAEVLFQHYRKLIRKGEAEGFWNIYPKDVLKKAA